jgi:hypothetical protein
MIGWVLKAHELVRIMRGINHGADIIHIIHGIDDPLSDIEIIIVPQRQAEEIHRDRNLVRSELTGGKGEELANDFMLGDPPVPNRVGERAELPIRGKTDIVKLDLIEPF